MAIALFAPGCNRQQRTDDFLTNANKYFEAGRFEEAEIEYNNVLRLEPSNPIALKRLGILFYQQGRWPHASSILARALKASPDDWEIQLRAGMIDLAAGRREEARAKARFILDRWPDNDEAILLLADASMQPTDVTASMATLDQLRQKTGDRAAYHIASTSFQLRTADLSGAEKEIHRALELDPKLPVSHILLGKILWAQGNKSEAEAKFQQGYALAEPTSLRRLQWPNHLIENGRAAEAYRLLQAMREKNPRTLWILTPLARAALDLGNVDDAEQTLKAAYALDTENVEVRALQAQLHLLRNNPAKAVEILTRLTESFPRVTRLHYQLALAQMAAGNEEGTVTSLKRVMELDPLSIPPNLMLAELLLRQRDASALTILNDLNRRLPDDHRVKMLRAAALMQSGKLDDALAAYQNLLGKKSDDLAVSYRIGQILVLQGDRKKARAQFESIALQAPDFLPALAYLANLDSVEGNIPATLARFRTAIAKHPESAVIHFLLAQIYQASGDSLAAEAEFKKVIELAPDNTYGYLALAKLYAAHPEQVAEAKAQLLALQEKQPNHPATLLLLAMVNSTTGNQDEAGKSYEALLKLQPSNLVALNNLAHLYAEENKNLDRASELALKARQSAPEDPKIADTYGWALAKQGQYTRAIPLLKEASTGLPADADVHFHLGMAYYMMGKEADATACFESAIRTGSTGKNRDSLNTKLAILKTPFGTSDESTLGLLRKALAQHPDDPASLKRLTAIHQGRGESAEILKLYQQAYDVNRESTPVLLGLAQATSMVPGQQAQALELARTARKLAPNDPEIADALGTLAFRTGDFSWALSLLKESAAQQPKQESTTYQLALCYYSLGSIEDAQRVLERPPLTENPKREQFRKLLALHQQPGDPSATRAIAEKVLQAEPSDIPAQMVLGLAEERSGNYTQARRSYEAVLHAYPLFYPAMKRLAIVAAEHLKDDALASLYGAKARELAPSDSELAQCLGNVARRRGDFANAIALLEEALKINPNAPDLLYDLGFAQVHGNELDKGKQTLSQALEKAPGHRMATEAHQVLAN